MIAFFLSTDNLPFTISLITILAISFIIALIIVRVVAAILSKVYMKKIDDSYAVPEETFIGKVAIITIGTAKKGQPAEAKLRDQYRKTHYVMVEPDGEDQFKQSTQVLLVRKEKFIFKAIKNPSKVLNNKDIE